MKDIEREFTIRNIEFKDVTSYSRGDNERKPTMFEANVGKLKIVVMSNHRYYPGKFVYSCHGLAIEAYELHQATTMREAAKYALMYTQNHLKQLLSPFPSLD